MPLELVFIFRIQTGDVVFYMVTALYDCRSKQEYIYRTNQICEISGASILLSKVYDMFIAEAEKNGIKIKNSWEKDHQNGIKFDTSVFAKSELDGEVIYSGGGNLNVIYKDRATFVRANQIFSKMLLDKTYSINMIAVCTETTDNFNNDRKELYRLNRLEKNQGTFSAPCNVLPITKIDRNTFMPICKKEYDNNKFSEFTLESLHKSDAFKNESSEKDTRSLNYLTDKNGDNKILAAIYIDGNDMGNKIKACTEGKDDYTECVNALREFSLNTDKYFVDEPLKAIKELLDKKDSKFRKIIGGGDEITIVCRAEDAIDIVSKYFEVLEKTTPLVAGIKNASCAGIAFFHSHMPFADVYHIAESCCESGKEKTRISGSTKSYIDFHYCSSSITNDLDTIRSEQDGKFTLRPYSTEDFKEFVKVGNILKGIGRGNVKALSEAIVKGNSYFQFETERIKSRGNSDFIDLIKEHGSCEDKLKRLIYDVSVVYDLWFAKEENVNVQTEN